MKRKLALCLAIAGLALANAKSFTVNLYQSTMVGKTELKAGEYKVELAGQKATLTKGKEHTEADVTVASSEKKYSTTTVVINNSGGKSRLQEIHLGGTTTKLVVAD